MGSRFTNKFWRLFISLFCLLSLLAGVTGFALAATKVPHFALPLVMDHKKVIDVNEYRGKVVLINFWATWCPPCRKELPHLVQLQNEFGAQGFSVLGISVDEGGEKVVKKFIAKQTIPYPVMMANQEVVRKFGGVSGIPSSFLVDQNGNVVKSYPGYVGYQILHNDIKTLIN